MTAPVKGVSSFANSIRGCIFGSFVGDALAMPAHWYYNIEQLRNDFNGEITSYQSPTYPFPGSILNLSNTGGGGRGSDRGSIIGDVINHGKRKYWLKSGQYHYHHGLKPGENTLDAHIIKVLIESIIKNKEWNKIDFLGDYVKFMTLPGSHNDVYASSAHRMFFANWVKKKPLNECADTDNHNIDAIDALTVISPLIISMITSVKSSNDIKPVAFKLICSLRKPSNSMKLYVDNYVDLLFNILSYRMGKQNNDDIDNENDIDNDIDNDNDNEEKKECKADTNESEIFRNMILNAADNIGLKKYVLQQAKLKSDPMVACYINSSYPALLVYAYKYYYDFNIALFQSVNGGGENVARSACLGALFGAFYGFQRIDDKLRNGLLIKNDINKDIDQFIKLFAQ